MICIAQMFYFLCCAFVPGSLLPHLIVFIHVVIFLHPSFKCLLLQEAFPASLRNVHLTLFVFPRLPQHLSIIKLPYYCGVFFFNFYWRIGALQCGVSVYSTAYEPAICIQISLSFGFPLP